MIPEGYVNSTQDAYRGAMTGSEDNTWTERVV